MYQQLQEEDSDSQFEFENPFQFDLQETLYTHKLDKILGTWSGVWLVVGVCIGSGIFASPGLVYDDTQSVGASLCVWLFSGVLSMLGALCYIELGTSYPDSGGELVYLTKAFGPSLGFIYSFCAVLLQRPASIAIISSTFAEYLDRSLNLPDFVSQITAPLFILILTLMNIYSVEKTQLFQHTSTITKLLCILLIGCLAMIRVVVGPRNGMLFETDLFHGSSSELGKYAVASYFSLWAYDGWNTLNLVTEEFQDPSTNLPKAVLQGLLLVTCSYIIINFTYFIVLSKEVFVDSITIALDFAEHIFGTYGPLLMTVIVFIAAASALNASIFASSRLLVAMSRRGHGPQKLGIVHQKTNTPVHSLILQLILSTIYCQVGDIKSLLTLYSFGTWFFYFLTVFGLLVLRYTDPYCSRPFKVWLIVPILFCGLSFFLVLFSVYHTPMAAIVFFSLILTSSLIYLLASRANMTFEGIDLDQRLLGVLSCFSGEILSQMIVKPQGDDRDYKSIVLRNHLQVLLIHDPGTEKASCSLDVHVGSHSDGEVDGLAHFLEHMLFMGTQKYPIENDYGQFLSSHGGHSNAYTAGEHTNYYFDVDHSFLQEAMDRFAQFFISPLFLEDGTEREMNAVDSEHKKNLQSDPWRVHQLEKDLCDPKHPYSRFGTGSLETLRDIPQSQGLQVRKLLLDFHKRYYSANIMKCVVLGRDSLETLEQWATECFSRIENNNVPVPSFETHPLSQNQLQQEIWVKPVKQSRSLTVSFPFPDSRQHYKTRPASYISHLVGHESEGSLLSYLKTKGWAQNLSAGHASGGIGFAFFSIHVELTQLGLDKYHDVICAIFQYIKMIQRQGPLEWIYDECRSVARMNFRFQEKSSPASYCSRTASAMHDYPTPDILSGPHLMEVFDPETIQRLLDLMQPHNFRVIVQNPKFETEGWTRAKWYGTEYKVVPFSSEFKQQLDQIQEISQMHLPERNQFIPDSFDLLPIESDGAPQIVLESPLMRLWYKQDHLFKIPKAAIYLEIISPLAYQDVRSCVLTRLFTELLKDALNEFSYAAELAGLDYSLTNTPEGMVLTLNGFSNKIHLLADQFILKMKQAEFSELQFHRIKERLNKSYHNWFLESPASQATYFVTFLLQDTLYHAQRKIQVLEHLTLQDLNAFVPQLLSKMFIQGFVHGNLHKQKVREIGQKMIQDLQYQALEEDQRLADVRTHIINGAEHTFYHLVYNPNNVNSAIEFCLQIGPENDVQGRALLGLLAQISGEPVFDQLRTKEQLGYSVYGGIRKMRWHGYRIVIQSERDPIYLEERIELFLRQFQQTLLEMPDEKFNKYKQAYVNNLLEKPKNLNQHSNRLWNIISSRYYDFDRNETDASFVQSIQKQQLVQFYQHAIVGPERRKISVHMVSQKLKDTQRQGQELVDEDVQEQKKQWPLSEPPVPAKRVDQFVIN